MTSAARRVAIVGGGAIGLMTAYHLAREGADVTVVDARRTGRGAAEVNAGWYCPGESAPVPGPGMVTKSLAWMLRRDSPLYIRPSASPEFTRFMYGMWRACTSQANLAGYRASLALARAADVGYADYRADGIDFELRSGGLLLAYRERENFDAHLATLGIAREHGLDPQVLVGDAVHEREPQLSEQVRGSIYFPHESYLDPNALMRGLHARLLELGATIIENAPLERVERDGSRVRRLFAGGRAIEADAYVLAAGAWSGRLARLFGAGVAAQVPVRPGKGYSVDVAPLVLRTCVNLADAKVAVTPLATRLRLAGTMEFGGLDERLDRVRVAAILAAPGRYFRDWQAPSPADLEPRAGLRPMTPDGLPVMGPLAGLDNAFVSGGHGMMGITFGPGAASVMTDLVLRERHNPVLDAFSPARFSRRRRAAGAVDQRLQGVR